MLLKDHKPLLAIFRPTSAVPTLAALRMQRWALLLLAYDYEIQYRRSCDYANADAFSHLPCKHGPSEEEHEGVFLISHVEELPVSAKDIAEETRHDPILSKVLDLTLTGWPKLYLIQISNLFMKGKISCPQTKDVFFGDHGWSFHLTIGEDCSQTYMRVIQESLE